MYTDLVSPVPRERRESSNRQLVIRPSAAHAPSLQVIAGLAIVALGLCAVLFAVGEQSTEDDSVRNLLQATKSRMPDISKMSARQQALYDSGMEDEAGKQMNIAYQTFMKAKDSNVVGEYDLLNSTLTEEQNALVNYADEMKAIELEVANEAKEHKNQYSPKLPSE
ncbi:hypothetical protein GUITHDRAFT_133060 [Guillardia theta CCMP2712]|uniref:Uncharacterized protein n=1 Tax=Guillardia theta (strain CCMP2712) TaxID=905079 RepID=L1JYQ3_GUITC|nr:hypothetical protein GUITHDRAFT_133060 [Guillardia theta CCMP2712]EKX53325.1 hypothetical protein GUITHDRAFT_133060 [Guillardia theta CCMP2712]|eukprot:XP_005840305.1 hypothetical protein GUITHDRAFT_133060 [Guillardia theta CCMP2712]